MSFVSTLDYWLFAAINGLAGRGYTVLGFYEDPAPDPNPAPGSWEHFFLVCAPWHSPRSSPSLPGRVPSRPARIRRKR